MTKPMDVTLCNLPGFPEYTGKGQPTAKPRHFDFCHILWLFPWDILICIRLTVPNSKWRESWLSSHWLIRFTFIFGVSTKPNSVTVISPEPIMVKMWYKEQTFYKMSLTEGSRGALDYPCYPKANTVFYSN